MTGLVNFLVSIGGSSLENTDLASLMGTVQNIGQTILYCIYIILGVFLIVKGGLLGMQIVKAADEPQVRQEKIGSLKWLVIGVVIAYGVSALANVAINLITSSVK